MGKERLTKEKGKDKESTAERGWRLYKNFNILGTLALGGLAVIVPVGGAVLATGAAINAAQAGFGEYMRDRAKKKRTRTKDK